MSRADRFDRGALASRARERRFIARLGPVVVTLAVIAALTAFIIFSGFTPITPTNEIVLTLFAVNGVVILVLIALVVAEAWNLIAAWRAQVAGSRLHVRIVSLFSIIAAAPSLLMAVVGSVALDRSANPAFMQDVRGFVLNTTEAARLFRESQCRSLLQEARLTAFDLDRGKSLFTADRALFHDYFASRVRFLGFATAVLMDDKGEVTERVDTGPEARVVKPEPNDFEDARKNEPLCLVLDEGRTFVALRGLANFDTTFLYVARPVDPFTVEFPKEASNLVALYDSFDAHRRSIQIAFATMYALLALTMLLSAIWIGLSFANRIVAPIRRLIAATDQVSSGNLYVQVPVYRSEGDLAHLGETFNTMTSELRLQQNRLLAASKLIDERRLFTEAVLSGVPAAVIGVSAANDITVVNPSAQRLLALGGAPGDAPPVGRPLGDVIPELEPVVAEARANNSRLTQSQIILNRASRERIFTARVTNERAEGADQSIVVTLDDITDLVSAQRTSAWADVARRIAHEIKNPLTPIQLSAERLKRKYSRVIVEDRAIFDQCTDTIVRQVDDIKRMVDEFSSFARMPKARLAPDDLAACVRDVVFSMRIAHADIEIDESAPEGPLEARFDVRLIRQALTNIIKNAAEGIEAVKGGNGPGRISIVLSRSPGDLAMIEVTDNGKGFPTENRARLLEPYMTTRAEGTGLGLPIVAKILEDHGGSIELLDAANGPGARVRLTLPIGAPTDAARNADPAILNQRV